MKTKIYYDGIGIEKYRSLSFIEGYTTNTSYVLEGHPNDYIEFAKEYLEKTNKKPCSFQVLSDNDNEIIKQALKLNSLGENVYVKIPIIKRQGTSNHLLIKNLLNDKIKINITVVHTIEQIDLALDALNDITPSILSVFAGGITDTGIDPKDIMKYAVNRVKRYPLTEVLWAGCQTNLNIVEAQNCECHIITVPDAILNKINRMNNSLQKTSELKINRFLDDAEKINSKF